MSLVRWKNQRSCRFLWLPIFPNSKILSDNGMVVKFELNGREFMGLNDTWISNLMKRFLLYRMRNTRRNRLLLGKSTKKWWKQRKSLRLAYRPIRNVLASLSKDFSWYDEWRRKKKKAPKAVEAFQKMIKFDIQALLDAVK